MTPFSRTLLLQGDAMWHSGIRPTLHFLILAMFYFSDSLMGSVCSLMALIYFTVDKSNQVNKVNFVSEREHVRAGN